MRSTVDQSNEARKGTSATERMAGTRAKMPPKPKTRPRRQPVNDNAVGARATELRRQMPPNAENPPGAGMALFAEPGWRKFGRSGRVRQRKFKSTRSNRLPAQVASGDIK